MKLYQNRFGFLLGFSTEAEANTEANKRRGKGHTVEVTQRTEGGETWFDVYDKTAQQNLINKPRR